MKNFVGLSGWVASLAILAPAASAQNTTATSPPATGVGAPQLRDFSLQPRQRIVTQPVPIQTTPPTVSSPPPGQTQSRANQPRANQPRPAQAQPRPTQQPAPNRATPDARRPATPAPAPVLPVETARPPATQPAPAPVQTAPVPTQPLPQPETQAPAPEPKAEPKAQPVPVNEIGGGFPWYYGIPILLFGLLIVAYLRQRRRGRAIAEAAALAAEERAETAAATARPQPQPRPWLELELKAERLSSTEAETLVQFELEITNSGAAPARNLRIDVKMFNAGEQQDQEIGAFFRTAGRESTKCSLPGIQNGQTGAIRGEVAMARDDMRAVVLDNRYLFIPVIAVNALYDYGDGQTGQTSKSYVVGRELEEPSEKMGAFRIDQGPRIWRSVGQRQHKLARRV
jgi:hypothetical protein